MFIFRNTGGKCNNFWQSGHEGGDHSFGIQQTHKRRTVRAYPKNKIIDNP